MELDEKQRELLSALADGALQGDELAQALALCGGVYFTMKVDEMAERIPLFQPLSTGITFAITEKGHQDLTPYDVDEILVAG